MLVVVVVRQTGHRLVGLRIERHAGLGVEIERLPAAGHQRQVERVAQRALADQLQAAAADRAHLLVERHTQRVPVETAAMTADDVRPTILSPLDLLD